MAVLAFVGSAHFAAERVHHQLQAIANAEHGQAQAEHARVGERGVAVVDGAGAPGENDSDRRKAADFVESGGAWEHYRENILFADAARNELRILRSEVEDYDGLGFHGRVSQITRPV